MRACHVLYAVSLAYPRQVGSLRTVSTCVTRPIPTFSARQLLWCPAYHYTQSSTTDSTASKPPHASSTQKEQDEEGGLAYLRRVAQIRGMIHEYKNLPREAQSVPRLLDLVTIVLQDATSRERDLTRGLGMAADQLLLLVVEAQGKVERERMERLYRGGGGGDQRTQEAAESSVVDLRERLGACVTQLLRCFAKNGSRLSMELIQHAFASCYNYLQALAFFEELKKCGVAMDVRAYQCMLFCLQQLEEESIGRDFAEERKTLNGYNEDMIHFIVHGAESQLIPESKPYLGRVMFADTPEVYSDGKNSDFDALGKAFRERYMQDIAPQSQPTNST